MKKILLLAVLLLCSCHPQKVEEKIKDIKIEDLFSIEKEEYLTYFYSDYCRHCLNIKEDVLNFYGTTEEAFFFLSVDENEVMINSNRYDVIGVDSLEDFYIVGTPSLIKITDGIVSDYYLGEKEILQYIEAAK